jgi:hypothetical protein
MSNQPASVLDRPDSPILPVTASPLQASVSSEQAQPGDTGPMNNAELPASNDGIPIRSLTRPERLVENFESFLRNQAYSDDQIRQLFYGYEAFKDKPGIDLFMSLLYADFIDWPSIVTACPAGKEITFSELLDAVKNALQQPSPNSLRCW